MAERADFLEWGGMRQINICGETLPHPGHVCAFFDSREQKYDVLVPFLKDAITAGDDVVNIVDACDEAAHLDTLLNGGVPVDALRSGQLNVKTSEQTYLHGGGNGLPSLLEFLRVSLDRARRDNHCLRTWGEMSWVARGELPLKDVLEYEARVNEVVPDFECTLLCSYDLAYTPPSLVSDILATHPSAIIKGRLRRTPHYVQPTEFLQMLSARES